MAEDYSISIKFYGTRGSIPVCDKNFLEFGGNTTCIQVSAEDKNFVAILDAGSGIRNLGKDIYKNFDPLPKNIIIAFSHFHWDHIQGFPFFGPAYDPYFNIQLIAMGKDREIDNMEEIFAMQMQSKYFPVQLENMGANFSFDVIKKSKELMNVTNLSVNKHKHPGGAWGYRLERGSKTVVICTDVEHGTELDPNVIEFARGADLLVHEAQYTTEELESHRGWGHSSYEQAIEVAKLAGVKQLIMTHHDPDHDDAFLLEQEKKCQAIFPNCALAREGMEITV